MKTGVKVLALILALVMAFSLAACGTTTSTSSSDVSASAGAASSSAPASSAPASTAANTKTTLNVGTTNALTTFQHGTMLGQNADMSLIFDYVMYPDASDGGKWKSNILESWTRPDDTTIILKVKDGITFNNGDKLTGEDVLFTIQSYNIKQSPFANMLNAFDMEKSTVSDDGLTVTIKLKTPWGPGLENMPMPCISKAWCEKVGWESQDWYNAPVGSGPYTVKEYVTGDHATFVKRADYWGDSSKWPYETIIVKFYSEASTCFMDLEKGAIDLAVGITNQDYERGLKGVDNVAVTQTYAGQNLVVGYNEANNPVTQNVNVRKALTISVEWAKAAEVQWGSLAVPCGGGFVPQSSPWYDSSIAPYEYDPELAKQLLKDEGYNEGDLNFRVQITPDSSDFATTVQYYWAQIGVNLTIETVDFPTLIQTYLNDTDPNLLMFNGGQTSSGEPYAYLQAVLKSTHGFPTGWISDAKFNELGDKFLATIGDVRVQANHELQQYVRDNYLMVDACDVHYGIAYNPNVISSVNIMGMNDSFFWWCITFK